MMQIPTTKISHTLLDYGSDLLNELPEDHTKEELEATMSIVVAVWNAITIDSWNKNNEFEKEISSRFESAPKQLRVAVKRLILRKKKKFLHDPRAVGNHWVRDNNGELVFGCEARLDFNKFEVKGSTN